MGKYNSSYIMNNKWIDLNHKIVSLFNSKNRKYLIF